MAEKTAKLHTDLCGAGEASELWLVGYSELKGKGIFTDYRDTLKQTYMNVNPAIWDKVYVFQHFSMNRFTIDLKDNFDQKESLQNNIYRLGNLHKTEIF